ncbi:MAG: NAD(P)H-binding protein [Candidatus Saccharibacteria bacterium]
MQITVFGASGKVGSLVVEEALRRGYTVTAFVHSHSLFAPSGKLGIVKGDIYNAEDVAKALKGSDAVISTLGSWGTPGRDVLTAAMRAIIPAMTERSIRRVVTLTGSGAQAPDKPAGSGHRLFMRLLAPLPAGKVFRDGEAHMRLLAASDLDWTTLRSPVMNNFGKGSYRLDLKSGGPLATINRKAVAAALLDQLDSREFLDRAPIIHRN